MDKIFETIVNTADTVAGWAGHNMAVLFFVLGFVFVLVSVYKFILISRDNKLDSVIMRELATFQSEAKDWDAEKKIAGFFSVLGRRKNNIGWVYYKYFVSHGDFSKISDVFTVEQYREVTKRMKVRVFSWVLFLAAVCVGFINLCWQFNFEYAAIKEGIFERSGMKALAVIGSLLAVVALHTIVFYLYRQNVYSYKTNLLKGVGVTAFEFFESLNPHYEQVLASAENISIPENKLNRIKAQIKKQASKAEEQKLREETVEKEISKEEEETIIIEGIEIKVTNKKTKKQKTANKTKEKTDEKKESTDMTEDQGEEYEAPEDQGEMQEANTRQEIQKIQQNVQKAENTVRQIKPRVRRQAALTAALFEEKKETASVTEILSQVKEAKKMNEKSIVLLEELSDKNDLPKEQTTKKDIQEIRDRLKKAEKIVQEIKSQVQPASAVTRAFAVANKAATASIAELLPRPKGNGKTEEIPVQEEPSSETFIAKDIDQVSIVEPIIKRENKSIQDKVDTGSDIEDQSDITKEIIDVESNSRVDEINEEVNNAINTTETSQNFEDGKELDAEISIASCDTVEEKDVELDVKDMEAENEVKTEETYVEEKTDEANIDAKTYKEADSELQTNEFDAEVGEENKEESEVAEIDEIDVQQVLEQEQKQVTAELKPARTRQRKKVAVPAFSIKYEKMHEHVADILKRIKAEIDEDNRLKAEKAKADRKAKVLDKSHVKETSVVQPEIIEAQVIDEKSEPFESENLDLVIEQNEIMAEQIEKKSEVSGKENETFETAVEQKENEIGAETDEKHEKTVSEERTVETRKPGKRDEKKLPVMSVGGVMRGIDKKPVKK